MLNTGKQGGTMGFGRTSNQEQVRTDTNNMPTIVPEKTSKVGWLVVYCFTSRSRIFHLYGDVTIAGEGLQI
jgi:hypothetical protein